MDPAGLDTIVILGSPGLPFLYRGEVKVPFRSYRDLVAVSLKPGAAPAGTEQVIAVARRMKLELVEVGEQVRRQNVLAFRLQGEAAEGEVARVVEELQRVEGVAAAGSVVRMDRESLSFLTDELVVKFKSHVDLDAVPEIARRFELSTLRGLPQAGNAFLFRSSGPATYALLEVAARLVESGTVEYAEPNLVSTVVDDAINPTDFLSPMQWHLPLINCPDAWQVISDNFGAGFTFGSPNLNIAVVDSGVDVGNLDFSGAVSNGSPKVYQIFDFQNMVGNNNSRQGGHGTCCAGIATALPNNPSGVAGQNEGAVGSGGNCRLMAIERPFPGSEVAYSDMYVWVGGFNPNSGTAGFPAQISPGADVITNSFGYSVGMPISGLMKDTFDLLTTYGRGGRGVLLFFSAGNNSVDFTLQRPWAAYTRTFAIAASSLDTDGVTEIRAPYSNFGGSGIIDVCAPSDSALGAIYDPPRSYGTVTPTDRTSSDFPPDAPGHWTVQTTMSAAATGVTSLTVASSAGFAGNQFIIIGPPGTAGAEFGMVTGVPDATHLSVQALKNAHGAGTAVFGGPANILTNFGGTSSATPLAAGVGALLLTVRPSLTWVQVRDLLRGTAVHIDAANTNLVGIWRDQNGVASNQPGYLGAVYSRWYGFGRIDAVAAVNGALGLGATADVIVRENLGDSGLVPSVGTFWNSPDIWVRNLSPAAEGAAALPPNYTTAGPTQDAQASHDNYVYVRVKNIGPVPTSTFYVRVYLSHWAGTEFVYPTDFIPTTRPSDPLPSPLVPGTYLLGEVQHGPLGPNGVDSVNVTWVQAAIPPETVIVNGTTVHWHPCLLVEISPQDGPTPAGVHVWDNNNLGQKNVTIDYASDDATFGAALVVGNLLNRSGSLELYVDRSQVPAGIHLYIDVLDPRVKKELKRLIQEDGGPEGSLPPEVVLLDETRVLVERSGSERCQEGLVVTLPRHARLKLCDPQEHPGRPSRISVGYVRGREVFLLPPDEIIRIPLRAGPGGLIPMIVGGVVTERVEDGGYPVGITQRDANGTTSGAAAVEVRVGKDREG
ncbi:MAG TPA: S8 family serine peptidase [Vicinamibacteria bacterium]|nr:S8 family serine peptidase [Vicinamibacteria bacterium]